jgi:flagellar basal-body rod modification protein FlgD
MDGVSFGSSTDSDTFMQLLVARLQNQNPLQPVDDAEFIQQLTQFSMLDAINGLRGDFSSYLQGQDLLSAQNLLGKTVEAGTETGAISGVVQGIQASDGGILLNVDGRLIELADVHAISLPSS